MEAVVWRKLGVFRRWPAVFSALVYALAAIILLMFATTLADAAPEPGSFITASETPHASSSPAAPTMQATNNDATLRAVPCTCRMAQRDYSIGDQVCIRGQRAVCDRVLNNTSWRFLGQSCPLS